MADSKKKLIMILFSWFLHFDLTQRQGFNIRWKKKIDWLFINYRNTNIEGEKKTPTNFNFCHLMCTFPTHFTIHSSSQ
mgnify:CR=1 FL=1